MTADAVSSDSSLPRTLARLFDDMGAAVRTDTRHSALEGIVDVATSRITGADAVAVSTLHPDGSYVTTAFSDELAVRADDVQRAVGAGPCLSAIKDDHFYRPENLATDGRWPDFAARITAELGVHSMLSYRMRLEVDGVVSSLNVYAREADAFTERDALVGLVLAAHGGLAVSAELQRRRSEQLEAALRSNREIGMAMGVLMNEYKITSDQAFGMLRVASQNSNRKLREVAAEVATTGTLEIDTAALRPQS